MDTVVNPRTQLFFVASRKATLGWVTFWWCYLIERGLDVFFSDFLIDSNWLEPIQHPERE